MQRRKCRMENLALPDDFRILIVEINRGPSDTGIKERALYGIIKHTPHEFLDSRCKYIYLPDVMLKYYIYIRVYIMGTSHIKNVCFRA